MGIYAAQCMCGKAADYGMDAQFELFSHMTRFFGYKVGGVLGYHNQLFGSNVTENKRLSKIFICLLE